MKHTNRLIKETSPYLLQHAHNPVDWYPWGEEALEKAKKENKPILVSIGYAACHWCHVMERESFENDDIAALMNEFFVNIKIDREERPDIDHIYMDAVQAMTGSGGWPLNVFLTPDKKPFYGGTYFPPVRAVNRSSWRETLHAVNDAYKNRKTEIESQAENLTAHLLKSNAFGIGKNDTDFSDDTLNEIATNILKQADKTWGGFGRAPKFPQTFTIQFLLRHYHYTGDQESLQQALLSLDRMIAGGIYDQLGGGFARYSTDEKWLAPHFEKMLYDNALLINVIAEAYQITKNQRYAAVIDETISFLQREMINDEGGFYSALDADSEGVEGKFYTWSKPEIDEILQEDSEIFSEFYNVTEHGNWEETNILWITEDAASFADKKDIPLDSLQKLLSDSKEKLKKYRSGRIRPQLDDKILLNWNALMNTALSKAYAATGRKDYLQLAVHNIAFLEKAFQQHNGKWFRTYKSGEAKYPAFLDDYAFLIQAYIHLQEVSGNAEYLEKAKHLADIVCDQFSEPETGLFYFTAHDQPDVIIRKKEIYDGATPSGNAIMAYNLYYLGIVFEKMDWVERSRQMTEGLGPIIIKYPTSFGFWACHLSGLIKGYHEIAIVGKDASHLLQEFLPLFVPGKILQTTSVQNNKFPLLKNRFNENKTQVYVCKDYICSSPVETIAEIKSVLK